MSRHDKCEFTRRRGVKIKLTLFLYSPISEEIGLFLSRISGCLLFKYEAVRVLRKRFDRLSDIMGIDQIADGRRVKKRYTGGIQPPDQENIGKSPAFIAGLFFALHERSRLVGSARSI